MYLILAALRRFTLGELHARRGLWDYEFEMAQDPEEKTLGTSLSWNVSTKSGASLLIQITLSLQASSVWARTDSGGD